MSMLCVKYEYCTVIGIPYYRYGSGFIPEFSVGPRYFRAARIPPRARPRPAPALAPFGARAASPPTALPLGVEVPRLGPR